MKEHVANEDIRNIRIENEMDRFGIVINMMEHGVFSDHLASEKVDLIVV